MCLGRVTNVQSITEYFAAIIKQSHDCLMDYKNKSPLLYYKD